MFYYPIINSQVGRFGINSNYSIPFPSNTKLLGYIILLKLNYIRFCRFCTYKFILKPLHHSSKLWHYTTYYLHLNCILFRKFRINLQILSSFIDNAKLLLYIRLDLSSHILANMLHIWRCLQCRKFNNALLHKD